MDFELVTKNREWNLECVFSSNRGNPFEVAKSDFHHHQITLSWQCTEKNMKRTQNIKVNIKKRRYFESLLELLHKINVKVDHKVILSFFAGSFIPARINGNNGRKVHFQLWKCETN